MLFTMCGEATHMLCAGNHGLDATLWHSEVEVKAAHAVWAVALPGAAQERKVRGTEVSPWSGQCDWAEWLEAAARVSPGLWSGTGSSVMQVLCLHPGAAQGRFGEGKGVIMCWLWWSLGKLRAVIVWNRVWLLGVVVFESVLECNTPITIRKLVVFCRSKFSLLCLTLSLHQEMFFIDENPSNEYNIFHILWCSSYYDIRTC